MLSTVSSLLKRHNSDHMVMVSTKLESLEIIQVCLQDSPTVNDVSFLMTSLDITLSCIRELLPCQVSPQSYRRHLKVS